MDGTINIGEIYHRLDGFVEFAVEKDAESVIIQVRCMKQALKS